MRTVRQAANFLALRWFAQTLSRKKRLKINHLLQRDSIVTGAIGPQASIDAVVEFCGRAGIGFAGR
jgi:hypothetical protein